jgi:hypothetical protein
MADAAYFAGFWLRHQRIGTRGVSLVPGRAHLGPGCFMEQRNVAWYRRGTMAPVYVGAVLAIVFGAVLAVMYHDIRRLELTTPVTAISTGDQPRSGPSKPE